MALKSYQIGATECGRPAPRMGKSAAPSIGKCVDVLVSAGYDPKMHRFAVSTLVASVVLMGGCGSSESNGTLGTGGAINTGGVGGVGGGGAASSGGDTGTGGRGGGGAGGDASSGGSSGSASGGAGAGVPDIPSDAKLEKLTPSEKGALCDWYVGLIGGYGVENACSAVTSVKNYANQAQCVEVGLNFNCPILTVGQFEMCALAQVPSHACEYPDAECHWVFCR